MCKGLYVCVRAVGVYLHMCLGIYVCVWGCTYLGVGVYIYVWGCMFVCECIYIDTRGQKETGSMKGNQ
jgi:hypothetical protein